jgi:putative transposase
VVLGVNLEGPKEVLGLWVAQQEGAKFWLQVLTELQNRGVKDIFIACVDEGSKDSPRPLKRCIRARKCSSASCIWCGLR